MAFRKAHPEAAGQTALVVDAGTAPKSYYPFTSSDPREQRVTDLPYYSASRLGAAVAFNSVLSIPYALDGIGKSLEGP
jgi:hypothetical protein